MGQRPPGNPGTGGFLFILAGYTGLAMLCAPWKTLVLILSLLEDEKSKPDFILFHFPPFILRL